MAENILVVHLFAREGFVMRQLLVLLCGFNLLNQIEHGTYENLENCGPDSTNKNDFSMAARRIL